MEAHKRDQEERSREYNRKIEQMDKDWIAAGKNPGEEFYKKRREQWEELTKEKEQLDPYVGPGLGEAQPEPSHHTSCVMFLNSLDCTTD